MATTYDSITGRPFSTSHIFGFTHQKKVNHEHDMKLMVSAKYFSRTFLIRSPSPLVNKRRAIVHKKCSQQPVIGKGRWGSSLTLVYCLYKMVGRD